MFRKYNSIENHYRDKEIQYWLERFPQLADEEYTIQEKIDGANISFVIEPDGTFNIAKRSDIIGPNEDFYNMNFIVFNKYTDVVMLMKNYAQTTNSSLNVYGEIFGTGIQKRINYGDGKRILFYDMIINERLLSPYEMEDFFSELNVDDMLIPSFDTIKGLQNALDFVIDDKVTLVYPDGGDIIEGIVIKPYYGTYNIPYGEETPTTKLGRPFYLKKKNEEFKESKSKREKVPVDERLESLRDSFREYVNENRVKSVFSKYGEIGSPKQIGEYIKHTLEDAKEEFEKDYIDEIEGLEKKELKHVYNVSKDVVRILNKYL